MLKETIAIEIRGGNIVGVRSDNPNSKIDFEIYDYDSPVTPDEVDKKYVKKIY